MNQEASPRYCVCLVSDFFYPRLGGVEQHQYQLAQGLLRRGHKVIVVTGSYGNKFERQGIRWLTGGLKVYYCPQLPLYNQASMPTLIGFFPLFRQIVTRERVDIVHGHQTTSALAHECILHSRTMGIKVVFTDHSLFGFSNLAAIHINKLMAFTLADTDHVITVSHCSKENLVLRASIDPAMVSVIPNAVDMTKFTPNPNAAPDPKEQVNIVILSRLVYRKGVDIIVKVIPRVCARFANVHFIIGGDGHKLIDIQEMCERHGLHSRVELLGPVAHADVRNVLVRGHIFLNCSLTEAFCIAVLEAVSCGLFVVSTRVGGVPEVLPAHMIRFAEPAVDDVVEVLCDAIPLAREIRPQELHDEVKGMYSWADVAHRTEKVYDRVMRRPVPSLLLRLHKYYACGSWAGPLFCLLVALDHLFWCLLEWLCPRGSIDIAPNWRRASWTHRASTSLQSVAHLDE